MTKEYKEVLKDFLSGEINLSSLRKFVDERLFDLRQDPDAPETEESKALSELELIILEVEDGFRQVSEIYECVKNILSKNSTFIKIDNKGSPSNVFVFNSTSIRGINSYQTIFPEPETCRT